MLGKDTINNALFFAKEVFNIDLTHKINGKKYKVMNMTEKQLKKYYYGCSICCLHKEHNECAANYQSKCPCRTHQYFEEIKEK